MSGHVVVIAADLRRATIKVTPGTYLSDVLQEACQKLNLAGDKYLIKHRQKPVELSVPFRTSGLLPGAKLELVQRANTPSVVQIALQIPHPDAEGIPGGRLIRKFPSDLTLWKVLRQFESGEAPAGRNLNLTARGVAVAAATGGSGQLYYETPVLNIMGKELSTFADFQKSLSQLGHNSGNVLIRLSYRTTQQPLLEAMEQISEFFRETEARNAKEHGESAAAKEPDDKAQEPPHAPATAHGAAQPPAQEQSTDSTTDEPPPALVPNTEPSKDHYRPVNVFLAPTGATPAAALAPVDEVDFMPTIAHAQRYQARLQESSRNKRLLSDMELRDKAAADEARLAAITSALVKVRFPDNTSSDWQVGPHDTGAFLYEAVRYVMASSQYPFRLVLPGGQTVVQDDSSPRHGLIKTYKLSGRVLVNLIWDDSVPVDVRKQPFLKANVAQRGKPVEVPEVPMAKEDNGAVVPVQNTPEPNKGEENRGGGSKKMPKWFKFGK